MLKLEGNKAVGYVAVYNSLSKTLTRSDGVSFVEVIKPGAFRNTISDGHNIFALSSHNREDVLGSTQAGTLVLREDATGLHAEILLPETAAGNVLNALL
jgi:HK97 family phage prohead protease